MGDRNWAIATHGYAIEAFTDAGQEYIMEQVKPYLSDGDYNEAFQMFAMECDDFIMQADEAEPYDVGKIFQKGVFFDVGGQNLLICSCSGDFVGRACFINPENMREGKLKKLCEKTGIRLLPMYVRAV